MSSKKYILGLYVLFRLPAIPPEIGDPMLNPCSLPASVLESSVCTFDFIQQTSYFPFIEASIQQTFVKNDLDAQKMIYFCIGPDVSFELPCNMINN